MYGGALETKDRETGEKGTKEQEIVRGQKRHSWYFSLLVTRKQYLKKRHDVCQQVNNFVVSTGRLNFWMVQGSYTSLITKEDPVLLYE